MCSEKKDMWIEFYKKTYNMFRENAQYSWDYIKFYTLTASAYIGITFTITVAILTNESLMTNTRHIAGLFIIALVILPILMYFIINIGENQFDKECNNLYEQLAIVMKIEEQNGFRSKRELNENSIFHCDKYYVPNRWIKKEADWNTSEEFIKSMKEDKTSFYNRSLKLFNYLRFFSIVLVFIIVSLGLYVIISGSIFIPQ
jgi:hypothetical protein